MSRFDVVIAGGGVAGSATALGLMLHDPALQVAVVEPSTCREVRLAETLPALAAIPMRRLGLFDRFLEQSHLPALGTRAAWGSPDLHWNESVFSAYGSGWNIDRPTFDRCLRDEARRQGALVLMESVVDEVEAVRRGGWEVAVAGAEAGVVSTRFLVDATGRRAIVARFLGAAKTADDHLLGATMTFADSGRAGDASSMVEAQHTAARLATRPGGYPDILVAASQRLDRISGRNWLAVGDAASSYDPLSSLGIFKALRGGILAAYAISDWLGGDERGVAAYQVAVEREYARYLASRTERYRLEQRWPHAEFWRRRHGRDSGRRGRAGSIVKR